MTEDVFNSINELKKIFAESRNARLFTVIPENFDAEVINAAKSDRDKLIEVLNKFYKENCQKAEGVDDFVTLFGVYCNYYILYGLHLILKEDDFGTNKIFENIGNASLKEYLSLIREGIRTQEPVHFEEAVKKNKDYSLAHFYLFLRCLRKYWSRSDYAKHEKELLKHYKAIRNDNLRKYLTGRSNFTTHNIDNYLIRLILLLIFSFSLKFIQPQNDDLFSWSYSDKMLLYLFLELMEKTKEENTNIFEVNAPPLSCPYLVTNTTEQRLGYFSMALGSYFVFLSIVKYFKNILDNESEKELSETLSFIKNEKIFSLESDKSRSKLLKFFSERKFKPEVKQFIDYILFGLHAYLIDIVNNVGNLIKKNPAPPILEKFVLAVKQGNLEMGEIYLGGKSSVLESYGMIEKINLNVLEIPKIDSKFMLNRSRFLGIPYEIKWTNQELYNLMERISIQHEKDTMVRDYMHTYSNMKADALYDIAQLLLKRNNPEDKETGRKLLLEYALKLELKNSVRIMQLMYKDHVGELKDEIRKSLVSEEDEHENIRDIFNKALRQCLINAFYGDPQEKVGKEDTVSKMHKNLKKIWGKTFLEDKRELFEQQFMEADFDCLAWLSREGINFTCEQEPAREKIFLERESFGSTFLKIIFDELCVNVFKYGDLKKEIRLYLSQNEDKDLVISFENHFPQIRAFSGTQIGLNLLRRRIQILREDAKKNCVEVVDDKFNKIFRIRLLLPADLFLNQGSLH